MKPTSALFLALALTACDDGDGTPAVDGAVLDAEPRPDAGDLDASQPDADQPDAAQPDAAVPDQGADMGAPTPCEAEYQGNPDWTTTLVVEPGSRLCAYAPDLALFDYGRVEHAIRLKATLQPQPGTYRVPGAAGDEAFQLPICMVAGDAASALGASGPYTVAVEGGIGDPEGTYLRGTMPVAGADPIQLSLFRTLDAEGYTFTPPDSADTFYFHKMAATAVQGTDDDERFYAACDLPANSCLQLTADGVDLRVDEHTWAGSPGRGFAAGLRLEGTFDGEARSIEGYAQISTFYSRHAFGRSHFFAFDAPDAEGHCGLRVDVGDQFDSGGSWIAYADCAGQPMGDRVQLNETQMPCP